MGYILKIENGIYIGDTIIKNISGKAYLNVISILDEKIEIRVPTLRLEPLGQLFDNHKTDTQIDYDKDKNPNIKEEHKNMDIKNVKHRKRRK